MMRLTYGEAHRRARVRYHAASEKLIEGLSLPLRCSLLLSLAIAVASAQREAPRLEDVLEAAGAYVAGYERTLALVAEKEELAQVTMEPTDTLTPRQIRGFFRCVQAFQALRKSSEIWFFAKGRFHPCSGALRAVSSIYYPGVIPRLICLPRSARLIPVPSSHAKRRRACFARRSSSADHPGAHSVAMRAPLR